MKIIKYENLRSSDLRKYQEIDEEVLNRVSMIIDEVRKKGDAALLKYSRIYDRCRLSTLKINLDQEMSSLKTISKDFQKALTMVISNIKQVAEKQFQALQSAENLKIKIEPGIYIKQKVTPIKRLGIYVPAGRYPLFSTLYMAAIPAQAAGVKDIIVCTPPDANGRVRAEIIYVASKLGIKELYAVGGAQAVAAMAYGTETIKPVDKIVGPGNIYVTAAKKLVFGRTGIDFIAGPTELLIMADDSVQPEKVAADLLAQAEHDIQAKPMLITFSRKMAESVKNALKHQLREIPTAPVAGEALQKNGLIIICSRLQDAADLANELAPEHLSLFIKNPQKIISKLHNFGCLFLGEYSGEVFGDYSAGTNHILPTNGASRYTGGLSVIDFLKFTSILKITRKGANKIARATMLLAEREGLKGHARSAAWRLTKSNIYNQ